MLAFQVVYQCFFLAPFICVHQMMSDDVERNWFLTWKPIMSTPDFAKPFINPGLTLLVIWYNLQWMIPLKAITFMTSNIVKPVLTITSIISVGVRWGRYSSSRFLVKCFIFSVAFQLLWVKTKWPQKTPKECGALQLCLLVFINTMKTIVIYSIPKLYLP